MPKLTPMPSNKLTPNANHVNGDDGRVQVEHERADEERRDAARERVVHAAPVVLRHVHRLHAHRALQIGHDVARLDARRELDPVPDRHRP